VFLLFYCIYVVAITAITGQRCYGAMLFLILATATAAAAAADDDDNDNDYTGRSIKIWLLTFVHIFANYWPIFKILLPAHFADNLQ